MDGSGSFAQLSSSTIVDKIFKVVDLFEGAQLSPILDALSHVAFVVFNLESIIKNKTVPSD